MIKQELLKKVGSIDQICDAKMSRIIGGKADQSIIIHVFNAAGLSFTVIPSRGLDIVDASFKGIPIAYISKNGIVSPFLYETYNDGFHRSFTGGLLTTCGLSSIGQEGYDDFEFLETHGRYSHIPAEDVHIEKKWEDNDYRISITGTVFETKLFGVNVVLKRTISIGLYSTDIHINDTVENIGFVKQPHMMLYHFNVGYPLLDSCSIFRKSNSTIQSRDPISTEELNAYHTFIEPINNKPEMVFFHENFIDDIAYAEIENPKLKMKFKVSFDTKQLPILIQWKSMSQGDYALGIEPSINYPTSRKDAKNKDMLNYLQPFEKRHYDLRIEFSTTS